MSFEAVSNIAQAEAQAKVTVAEAESKAKQMLADADTAGKLAIDAACAKAEEEQRCAPEPKGGWSRQQLLLWKG